MKHNDFRLKLISFSPTYRTTPQSARARLCDPGAGGYTAGEGNLLHARVLNQCGACRRAVARDNVDRARRQQVAREVRPLEHAQRRVLARLDHASAAGGNAGRNLPEECVNYTQDQK